MRKFSNEVIAIDNVVRVSSEKNIMDYVGAVLKRGLPKVYKKYGCIRVSFTKQIELQVKYLCLILWHHGYVIDKKVKMKNGIPMGNGILIADAREIVLKKIGAIQFEDNEEFEDAWRKVEYEAEQ